MTWGKEGKERRGARRSSSGVGGEGMLWVAPLLLFLSCSISYLFSCLFSVCLCVCLCVYVCVFILYVYVFMCVLVGVHVYLCADMTRT